MIININLVSSAAAGNRDAFGKLYECVYKELYHYALYMLGRKTDAEDAVSETVIDAFSGLSGLKEPKAFKSWIFKILHAKCMNKRREYIGEASELPENTGSDDNTADLISDSYASHLLSLLDEPDRTIVLMHVIWGFKSREIAKILNLNSATVRSRESRALKKLRKEALS